MKSVNEMLEFLRGCLSRGKQARRSTTKATNGLGTTEAVEARLLLAADISGSLYDSAIMQDINEGQAIDSYLVAFSNSQNVNQLQAATGAASVEASPFVNNAYTLEFDNGLTLQEAADSFPELPGFTYLHPNVRIQYTPFAIPNDPLFNQQWHLGNTGQGGGTRGADANIQAVWDNYTGAGVTIAIVDDGLETGHEDFVGNINTTLDYDWNDVDNDPNPVLASNNHGTSVAGVAAARGDNGIGVAGAAYEAEIVGYRLISGPISDRDIAESQSRSSDIIDVYNNSWGPGNLFRLTTSGPQTLAAIEDTTTNGRGGLGSIIVFSAGNSGPDSDTNYAPLQGSRHTITVAASTNEGTAAAYTTPGATVVVSAPSNGGTLGITTTDRTGAEGYDDPENYTNTFGGTSSAAPLVSGIIALMLEANPNLSYRDVTDILARTSERIDPTHADWSQNGVGLWVNHTFGFGDIDATAAVNAALTHFSLGPETSKTSGVIDVNQPIPDAGTGSLTETFTVSGAEALPSLEYVEVVLNGTHQEIGELEIKLTSPSGTESLLSRTRITDPGTTLNDRIFTTVRNWGESSEGTWTLTVTDGAAGQTGVLNDYEIRFFGAEPSTGVVIRETAGGTTVSDSGQTDTIDVRLSKQPASDVVLNVVSNDTTEVTVSTPKLIFTASNWDQIQTVTVSGVFDLIGDGDQVSNVVFSVDTAVSDPALAGLADTVIPVTSIDDDEFYPEKPVVTAPVGITNNTTPTFTWTTGANTDNVTLRVTNRLTGLVSRSTTGLKTDSHQFAGLLPNAVYETTVQAFNSSGQGGAVSEPVIFAIGTPALPTAPVITFPTVGQIVPTSTPQFAWTPVAQTPRYEIMAVSGTRTFSDFVPGNGTTGGNPTHTFAQGFAEGPATVRVRAYNAFDQVGPWSEQVLFTIDAVPKPARPTIIRPAAAVTSNAFPEFRWIAPGGSKYELWVGRVPDVNGAGSASSINNRVIRLTDHNATSYTHFIALRNSSYVAWVRSFNSAGEASTWSLGVSFEVNVPVPARPAVISYVENQGTNPTIRWATTGEDFTLPITFHLWVNNLSTGQARVVQEKTLTTTSYSFTDGLPQGRYGVWVQATSAVGAISAWSKRFDFAIDIAAPGRPTLTGPVPLDGDTVVKTDFPVFGWDAVPNGASYDLWVNSVSGKVSQIIRVTDIPAGTSYTHDEALPEGTYKAWLRSFNLAGEVGEWSRPIEFWLDVPGPAKPTITGPLPGSGGAVETSTPVITWTSLGGATTYNLQFEVVRTGESLANVTGLTEQQFSITDTLSEQSYRVRVQGVNSVGEAGSWSDFYTFTVDVPNATTPVAYLPEGTVTKPQVTFQWQHTTSSVRYEILVRDLLRQESIVLQVSTLQIDQTVGRALHTATLSDGTYRYWVRAFNTQGTASGWSNSKSFTVDTVASLTDEPKSDLEIAVASLSSVRQFSASSGKAEQATPDSSTPAADTTEETGIRPEGSSHPADVEAVMAEFADPTNESFSQET